MRDAAVQAVTAHVPGAVRFNERFKQLACHYGFVPKACRPYRPRTKGKVERIVGYTKQHFFQRYRAFESFAHLNQLLEAWLLGEADRRLHGRSRGAARICETCCEGMSRGRFPGCAPISRTLLTTLKRKGRQCLLSGRSLTPNGT